MFGLEVAALTGWSSLGYAFGAAQTGLAVGLMRGREDGLSRLNKLIRSPFIAAGMTLFGSIALSIAKPWLLGMGFTLGGVTLGAIAGLGAIGYLTGRALARMRSSNAVYQRGTVLLDEEQTKAKKREQEWRVQRERARESGGERLPPVTIAGIPLTLEDEKRHFKFIGTTGSGKTTAIKELLHVALARGDRAIILDPDGDYSSQFYDRERGDKILNPFDKRSQNWDLFGEIRDKRDIYELVHALTPDPGSGGGGEREWREYARTFMIDVMTQLWKAGDEEEKKKGSAGKYHTVKELYRVLTQEPEGDKNTPGLRGLLKDTPSMTFLNKDNARMFNSIRGITGSLLRSFQYIHREGAPPETLSVRQWVREGKAGNGPKEGGVLFLTYKAGDIQALRSIISTWARLGISEAMEKEAQKDQRLWFVVDELDALGRINGLKDALTKLRKFGGRVILGLQSIAQISGIYGREEAKTIQENCRNTLILNSSNAEGGGTSEFASRLIGDREVIRTTGSTSRRPGELFGSTSDSEHYAKEAAVMAAEIDQLSDLRGYLRISDVQEWMTVQVGKQPSWWQKFLGIDPIPDSAVNRPRATNLEPLPSDEPGPVTPAIDTPYEHEYEAPQTASMRAASKKSRNHRREASHEPEHEVVHDREVDLDGPFF